MAAVERAAKGGVAGSKMSAASNACGYSGAPFCVMDGRKAIRFSKGA